MDKQALKQARLMVLTAMLMLPFTLPIGAQVVVVPSWAKPASLGGLALDSSYTPPEYNGLHGDTVSYQLVPTGRLVQGKNADFKYSPTSGILKFRDRTGVTNQTVGWNTGFSRVYAMETVPRSPTDNFDLFNLVVWDSTLNKSVLQEVKVLDTGVVTQSVYGIASPADEIWGAMSLVNGKLYLYELQSHTIIRYIDSNSNGKVDARDTGFSVAVPMYDTTLGPGDTANSKARQVHPIRRFHDAGLNGIQVLRNGTYRSAEHFIKESLPGVFSYVAVPVESIIPPLTVAGDCTTGQSRVLIYGKPGLEFKVYVVPKTGPVQSISSTNTIPSNGIIIVETATLMAGSKIQAQETGGAVKSGVRKVWTSTKPIIFTPNVSDFQQRSHIKLDGDKLTSVVRIAHLQWDGGSCLSLVSRLRSDSFEIDLPIIGTSTGTPPYTKRTRVKIWLEDSSGNALSEIYLINVDHD